MKHNRFVFLQKRLRGALLSLLVVMTVLPGMLQPAAAAPAAAAAGCQTGRHCTYLPAVSSNAPSGDLILSGVEVTQAIQDSANKVPLVAGRKTILRIYARSGSTSKPISNVQVQVSANSGGSALNSSPAVMTTTVPLSNTQKDYNSTINYELPVTWLEGTVDLTIRLDPSNRISETNESNNAYQMRLTFTKVPPLKIKIVPIRYTHTDGKVYPAPTIDSISDWINRIYPVNKIEVSWHAPYSFNGNLSSVSGWYDLLDLMTALKSAEGAPTSQVYYALVPPSNGSSTWFNGGVGGIGWVGSRVSIGMDTRDSAAQTAAHEIGHNLGMSHTPCGNPSSVDPAYPYKNGSIGQYGLDVWSGKVYTPSYLDIMTYCTPRWISDYTYKVLFNSQVKYGASSPQMEASQADLTQRSLMVRYRLNPEGVQTMPAYVLSGPAQAEPEQSDYTVQILGAEGEVLSETRVEALLMALDGAELSAIHAVVPLPDRPAAGLRLLREGQVLAEQPLQVDAPGALGPQAAVTQDAADAARLRWEETDRPALVRYSSDGGQTWTVLGIDATGGELLVSTAALPDPDGIIEGIPAGAWAP